MEGLGEVVLGIRLDQDQAVAGLERFRQAAERSAQGASKALGGIGGGPTVEPKLDLAGFRQSLRELADINAKIDVNSEDFVGITREIERVQQAVNRLDARKAVITADFIVNGLNDGSITQSIANVRRALEGLNNAQINVDVDSAEFATLGQAIVREEQRLQQLQNRQTTIRVQYIVDGLNNGEVTQSIQNIRQALQGLGQVQANLDVDSTDFVRATEEVTRLERRLADIDGRQAEISANFTVRGLDDGSITQSIGNVRSALQNLGSAQVAVRVDSSAFEQLGARIVREEQRLQRLEDRQTEVRVRYLVEGLNDGQVTSNLRNIQGLVQNLDNLRASVDVNSPNLPNIIRLLQEARQRADALTGRSLNLEVGNLRQGLQSGQLTNNTANIERFIGLLQQQRSLLPANSREFSRVSDEISRTQRELDRLNGTARNTSGIFGNIVTGLAGLGAGATLTDFFRGSINAAVELENITRRLSNTLGSQGAADSLAFTRQVADQLGLSFKTLASSFGSFTAAATAANIPIKDQEALFAAIAKAGQALGLSNFEIQGSLLALQQIASKGTVSFEELRQQLGERLPIALAATANGLGITQQQLIKLVESGNLGSGDFFTAITKGLNELTQSAAGAPTAAQNFQILANAFDELQTSVGQNILPKVIEQVKQLVNVVQGAGIVLRADKIGLGGGLLGNVFGILPEGANEAVVALRGLETQFNLTERQANALFTDALKQAGVTTEEYKRQKISVEQIQKAIEVLPQLAERFKARSVDATGELNRQNAAAAQLQQNLAKTADTPNNLSRALKEAGDALNSATIDTPEFEKAVRDIASLQARIAEIDGRKAVITAEFILRGIQDGTITNSLANARNAVEQLNNAKAVISVESPELPSVIDRLIEAQQRLDQVDGRVIRLQVEATQRGLEEGTVSPTLSRFRELISNYQRLAEISPINGSDFAFATREIQRYSQLITAASQVASKGIIEAARAAADTVRNISRSLEDLRLAQSESRGTNSGVNSFLGGQALANRQRSEFNNLLPLFLRRREQLAQSESDPFVRQGIRNINFSGDTGAVNRSIIDFLRASNEDLRRAQDIQRGQRELKIAQTQEELINAIGTSSNVNSALIEQVVGLNEAVTELTAKNWQVNVFVPGGSASGDVVGSVNALL